MKSAILVMVLCLIPSFTLLAAEDASAPAVPPKSPEEMEAQLPPPQTKGKLDTALDPYWEKSSRKLDRAVPNLLLGWTEAGSRAVDRYREDGNRARKSFKFWQGAGEGLVFGLWNTTAGALDTVTFLIPIFQTPLHDGGVNLKRAALTA